MAERGRALLTQRLMPRGSSGGPAETARAPRRLSALVTAGHLVGAQLVVGAASLVINAMAARTMGPSGRGSLALLLQITYLTNMIAMAGTDRSYPATVRHQPSARHAAGDTLRLVVPSAAVCLVAAMPVVAAVGGGARNNPLLIVVGFAVTASALVTAAALRTAAAAAGVVRPYLLATVVGQLTLVAAAAVLTGAGVTSPDVWLLTYGTALGVGPLVAWSLLRRSGNPRPELPRSLAPARRLGLRLLPAAVASMVMLRADRFLLPWLGSYEQLGLYVTVATVAEFACLPVQSYVDAQASRWHQRFLAGELRRGGPLLLAGGYGVTAGLGLLAAGHLLVVPVFGAEYRDSVPLLAPLAVGAACYSVSRIAIGLSVAAGQARGALAADLPAMVVAMAAYLVLIPRYGAAGAAVGSAIAYGVGALLAIALCGKSPAVPPGTRSASRSEESSVRS